MILDLLLPGAGPQMRAGTVHRFLARPGDALRPGSALLEVRVDLSAAKAQDCPPIVYFRILATERAHLRSWTASAGADVPVGGSLGVATSAPDESPDGPGGRSLRTTMVAIQVDPLSIRG